MGRMDSSALDMAQKIATVVLAAAVIGMFKFYVDVQQELSGLKAEVERANHNTSLILSEINRLHPRK